MKKVISEWRTFIVSLKWGASFSCLSMYAIFSSFPKTRPKRRAKAEVSEKSSRAQV
jgi:hypothetical protein